MMIPVRTLSPTKVKIIIHDVPMRTLSPTKVKIIIHDDSSKNVESNQS